MAEKKTERKTTRYVVLALWDAEPGPDTEAEAVPGDLWRVIGEFDTHGQDEAKRAAAEEHGAGSYAACPVSSWKVTPYGPKTVMVPLTGIEQEEAT